MSNILWTMNRIRKMPIAEYFYRLNQLKKISEDKIRSKRKRIEIPSWDGDHVNIPAQDVSEIEDCFPGIRRRAIEESERILKHRFTIFGIDADFGDPIHWHLDPKTGRSWPLVFWGDIDFRDGERVGGIKFAWELNRFNHLPRLAIAFALTRDSRFKEEIFRQIDSWTAANPYPLGINWIMGIELAIRIVNVVYALRFLGSEDLTDRQKASVFAFVAVHARHIERYPSKYSSAGNHAIAEALGLYVAGSAFPGFKDSQRWKETGQRILTSEIGRQIYSDGGSFEHSLPYLQFVVEQVAVYFLISREAGSVVSGVVEERFKASLDFLAHLVDRRGHLPLIGDGDDGSLLKLCFGPQNKTVSLLNMGAVLFNRPDWISDGALFDEQTAFLLGCGARATWEDLHNRRHLPASPSRYFPQSGLAVLRSESSPEVLFIGNSGALGAPPLGAHGHADALSFWLSVDGRPVFIDTGTYLFHGGGRWRDYFRSSAAHNTIRVDGADQAEIFSDFMYKKLYKILNPRFIEEEGFLIWSAEHDGFRRLNDSLVHQRTVSFDRRTGSTQIKDYLHCRGPHAIESRFHFHPDWSIKREGNVYDARCGDLVLEFQVDRKWDQQQLSKAIPDPPTGWYSPAFNVLQECWSLVLKTKIEGETAFFHSIRVVGNGQREEMNR